MENVYERAGKAVQAQVDAALSSAGAAGGAAAALLRGMVWTRPMLRMYDILRRCLEHSEPVLLVGETGTGKTTVCQTVAFTRGQRLRIINCNQHTESSDFLGGFRPNRCERARRARRGRPGRAVCGAPTRLVTARWVSHLPHASLSGPSTPVSTIPRRILSRRTRDRSLRTVETKLEQLRGLPFLSAEEAEPFASRDLSPKNLAAVAAALPRVSAGLGARVGADEMGAFEAIAEQLRPAIADARVPFRWVDGPVVQAMKNGDIVLVDELNLADDSVLERLNRRVPQGGSACCFSWGPAATRAAGRAPPSGCAAPSPRLSVPSTSAACWSPVVPSRWRKRARRWWSRTRTFASSRR